MSQVSDGLLPLPVIPDHTLVRPIGRGAYGEVWLARNVMGTWRAVKVIRRSSFSSEGPYIREFEGIRKFEPISRSHETQLHILHIGQDEAAAYFYYIMELADDCATGQEVVAEAYVPRTLATELRALKRLPVRQCIEVGIGLAAALEHLHKHSLVHRDIKPANVIFVHGRVKLADIGLVAIADEANAEIGTDGYFPSEGSGSPQADVFGVGRLLYEIFTGLSPLRFPDIPASFGDSPNDAGYARELNLIINKACAPDARDRHSSAGELKEELMFAERGASLRKYREAAQRVKALRLFGIGAAVIAMVAVVGYLASESANRSARKSLASSLVSQVQMLRSSDMAGRRQQALQAIAEAAQISPSEELRDHALALLPTADAGAARKVCEFPDGFTPDAGRLPLRTMVSPDGTLVVWMMDDGTVRVVDIATGREVAERLVLGVGARTVSWSPGGNLIGAMSMSKVVLWDWRKNRNVFELDCSKNDATSGVSFSSDERRAALTTGEAVMVVDCVTGKELRRWATNERSAIFALHPQGNMIGVVSVELSGIFAVDSGAEIARDLSGQGFISKMGMRNMVVSSDGAFVVTTMADGALGFVNLRESKATLTAAHLGAAYHAAFSRDGELLLTASPIDGTRVWRTRDGVTPVVRIPGFGLSFSPDGGSIYLVGDDGIEVRVLERNSEYFHILRGDGKHRMELLATDPTGRLLAATGDKHDTVDLWDIHRRKQVGRMAAFFSGRMAYGWIGFSSDGSRLLAVGEKGLSASPISKNAGEIKSLGPPVTTAFDVPCEPGSAGAVSRANVLAVRASPNHILLQDLEKNGATRSLNVPDGRIESLAWSPDCKSLAVSLQRGGSLIYDASTLQILKVFPAGVSRLGFSPDGRFIVRSTTRYTELLRSRTFEQAYIFQRPKVENVAHGFDFSPDGELLAIFQNQTRIDLVETAGFRRVATLEPPVRSMVDKLMFVDGGKSLVVSDRNTSYCYDIPALRRELAKLGLDW
jgi:serine/threonine protein kinase/WD40 repeat protein